MVHPLCSHSPCWKSILNHDNEPFGCTCLLGNVSFCPEWICGSFPSIIPEAAVIFSTHHHNFIKPQSDDYTFQFFQLASNQEEEQDSTTTKTTSKFVECILNMPIKNMKVKMNIEHLLSVPSLIIMVRYKVPFELDVSPKKNGLTVCTKDGSDGKKVNDVLRFTSQWTLGFPQGDGLLSTTAAFGGGVLYFIPSNND